MLTFIVFVFILSFLVVIHELGHFITARKAGVTVEEFGLGYPPKALTLFKDKKGTVYTLNWLPFGGFVRLKGEDSEEQSLKHAEGAFFTKPVWKRLVIVLAGAVVNFLFGALAFGVIYSYVGIPRVVLDEIIPNSPAATAGLAPGSQVEAVVADGKRMAVDSPDSFVSVVRSNRGETINLIIANQGEIPVYVRTEAETPANEGALGVVVGMEPVRYPMWEMPFRGIWIGLKAAGQFGLLILSALGSMVTDLVSSGNLPKDVAGPVGIVHVAQREGILTSGWLERINFAAVLSINLAIINVLPFPALDGGRAFFLLIELFTRRRLSPKFERWANAAGFAMLLAFIMVVTLRDVKNVFLDQGVQQWFQKWLP